MAHAAKVSFGEFRRRYSTEEACRAELFRLRFPRASFAPSAAAGNSTPSAAETPISAAPAGTKPPLPPAPPCTAQGCR